MGHREDGTTARLKLSKPHIKSYSSTSSMQSTWRDSVSSRGLWHPHLCGLSSCVAVRLILLTKCSFLRMFILQGDIPYSWASLASQNLHCSSGFILTAPYIGLLRTLGKDFNFAGLLLNWNKSLHDSIILPADNLYYHLDYCVLLIISKPPQLPL